MLQAFKGVRHMSSAVKQAGLPSVEDMTLKTLIHTMQQTRFMAERGLQEDDKLKEKQHEVSSIKWLCTAREELLVKSFEMVSELSVPVPFGELRGKVWGPDHGHPVLCLHGWADNCGTFNTLIPLLPKEYRYVAVDLAGHGLSSHRPPGDFYSFPSYVMDVCRVVDALQWSKFSIIGHSMGGNVAGMFSALYPEKVDSVVLLDSYGFLPTDLKGMIKAMRQGMDQMIQFDKKTEEEKRRVYTYENAVKRLTAANPTLSEPSLQILLERGLVQVEGGVEFTRDLRINLKNIARISLEQSQELLSKIRASILVILAEDGFQKLYITSEQNEPASAILQAFRDRHTVVTVPGDHHIHLNDPRVVAPLVSDFLQNKVLTHSVRQTEKETSKL